MSYFREQLESWLKDISVTAQRVVDFGGAARPVKDRVKFWDVKEYIVIDNFAEKVFEKQLTDQGIAVLKHDLAVLMRPPIPEEKADVGFCLELMEYVWNPVATMVNIASWIRPGGKLFISFPFVYPIHNPPGIDYYRYTEFGAIKLLQETGFETLEVIPRVGRDRATLRGFYASDGMHPIPDKIDHTGYLIRAERRS